MIGANDRVMVCLSGGKDSFALLDLLLGLQKRAPVPFSVVAFNLDQRQPGFPADVLPAYLKRLGVEYHIETEDTYSTVQRVIPEEDQMLAVLATAARHHLPRDRRAGRHPHRARPPS